MEILIQEPTTAAPKDLSIQMVTINENIISLFLTFLGEHASALQQKMFEHVYLSGLALILASFIAIPLGIGVTRLSFIRNVTLKVGSISQTIPSLAMLALLVPFLGLGTAPTLVVLVFYAIYPILRSTYTGLESVPLEYLEAAKGLGFSSLQTLWLVELPLALPVIISGIRVASALTIGITAIAAFIGAGGLGDFITQGLSLNDPSLILLGAIPIALLAIVFDYGISQVETRLQTREARPYNPLRIKNILLISGGLLMILWMGNLTFQTFKIKKEGTLVIASKNFTEQYLLAELMAQQIESKTNLKVIRKFNLGTTDLIHKAMLKGEVDLYPEYSGTAYLLILKRQPPARGEGAFKELQSLYKEKFGLIWMKPFGFSNVQSLAIKKTDAHKHQVFSLSDFARISKNFKIAAPPEFLKRPDAFPGLRQAYGLSFKKIMQVDPNLMYAAIEAQKVNSIASFSTDGKLEKYDLVLLTDDRKFYPSYQPAPLIRQVVLETHPNISEALLPLLGNISEETMKKLNHKVDVEGHMPSDVVREFLSE